MPSNKHCPACHQAFMPRRKNQLFCTTECRTDANNALAKQRYHQFKLNAPKVESVTRQLHQLRQQMANQMVIITGVTQPDRDTISYQGRIYHRTWKADLKLPGIILAEGGAVLLPGNVIAYGLKGHTSGVKTTEYVLQP